MKVWFILTNIILIGEAASYHTKPERELTGGKKHHDLPFADPALPAVCPIDHSPEQKIPQHVIEKANKSFNGAVVSLMDTENEAYDIVEMIGAQGFEPYPTPLYEYDPSTGTNRTPPEPYAFRTALPVLQMARCNPSQKPYVVFIPASYREAARTIKIIRRYDEAFTIISGGHDYECQSATNKALIITSLLDKIKFDFEEEIVTVGAGVLWSNVYDKLLDLGSPYGPMGAQCGLVSVSGYILGGGYSWHMSKYYGIAAESVIEMKVILANGDIVTATHDNEHSDLIWALAGSGGLQLGFVVEFKMRLFRSPEKGGFNHSRVEYRFDDVPDITYDSSNRTIYPWSMTKEMVQESVLALNKILDEDRIGTPQVRYRKYRGDGTEYRMEINTPCQDCLADEVYPALKNLKKRYPPTQIRYQNYNTIPEFLSRRRNSYPDTVSDDRGSHYISGGRRKLKTIVEVTLDYFDPTYETEKDPSKIATYFDDVNFYGIKDIIKHPDLTSINSEATKASWHVTARSDYADYDSLYSPIKCYVWEWNNVVRDTMGDDYHGAYINYLDGVAEKSLYYGKHLRRLEIIKRKYDPTNFFKRIKGISMNDPDMKCIEELCKNI